MWRKKEEFNRKKRIGEKGGGCGTMRRNVEEVGVMRQKKCGGKRKIMAETGGLVSRRMMW